MLIVGARGLAKEVLEIFHQKSSLENLYFYDDISTLKDDRLFAKFQILKNTEEVNELFKTDKRFCVGLGNPGLRLKMFNKFNELGGQFISVISPLANIGYYGTIIEEGAIIMAGVNITSDIKIGKGVLINPNCTISHDTVIGDFVEISPGVQITGNCVIGNYCNIGANATILPKLILGDNVTVGAGAVVTKNVPGDKTVAGVPAKEL